MKEEKEQTVIDKTLLYLENYREMERYIKEAVSETSQVPKERVQVGTRQVVNGERERLMIIQDRCMKQCRQGASDFGLTVSSRCRLVVPKPQQQKPENKFAKYAN